MGVHWKVLFLGGSQKKTIFRGDCVKMGAWTVCKFKSRVNEKEGVVVNFFFGGGGGWYANAH